MCSAQRWPSPAEGLAEIESLAPLDERALSLALGKSAYAADRVRLVRNDLQGFTHIVASRQGLYAVNERSHALVAHGLFFGITLRGPDLFAFEACDRPHEPTRMGRIVRFGVDGDAIVSAEVVWKGLDNGCHGMDFIGPDLHVVDTYRQQVLRFAAGAGRAEVLCPLPAIEARTADPAYVHANSILALADCILLLLHHGAQHAARPSEIAVFDLQWQPLERIVLPGTGCHGLAQLEDGTLLTCGSLEGTLISPGGISVTVSPLMTRGLSVGADTIAVGGSPRTTREARLDSSGTVTFLDREYRVRNVLSVPGAPTEIRRLDGQDRSLSGFVAGRSSSAGL